MVKLCFNSRRTFEVSEVEDDRVHGALALADEESRLPPEDA